MVKTQDARSLSAESQEALSMLAIRAVETGTTRGDVAKQFGVARGTVNRWVKQFRQKGTRALKA